MSDIQKQFCEHCEDERNRKRAKADEQKTNIFFRTY